MDLKEQEIRSRFRQRIVATLAKHQVKMTDQRVNELVDRLWTIVTREGNGEE